MDLDSVADELYGLPLVEFTSTRNAREKQAKAAGDTELAAQIRALQKPNTIAWLANQLVRERPDEIDPLLQLGAALREATANLSREQLRELSQQEHRVVYALVQQAKQIAAATGQRVSDEVGRGLESTLRAALADAELADRLAEGRLTDTLEHVGFGLSSGTPPAPAPSRAAPRASRRTPPATEQIDRARTELAAAERAAKEKDRAREQASAALDDATAATAAAAARVEELQQQLSQAMLEQRAAERDERKARAASDRATQATREAARHREDAKRRLDALHG